MIKVEISKTVASTILNEKGIVRILKFVYLKERVTNAKVSSIFIGDKMMKRLHQKYLSKNSTTDVLTFVLEKNPLEVEICVNVNQAKRQAKRFGVTLKNEITRLLVHCALHSLGYDDTTKIKRRKMFALQEKYILFVGRN
ncbi:MAG: rRNA maturation RNase YbeY [Bacteroidota bacterium]